MSPRNWTAREGEIRWESLLEEDEKEA